MKREFDLKKYLEDKIKFSPVGLNQNDFNKFINLKIKANTLQLTVMRDDLINEIERRKENETKM